MSEKIVEAGIQGRSGASLSLFFIASYSYQLYVVQEYTLLV